MMPLIYRGYTINYTPRPIPAYRQPNALNWRRQMTGKSFQPTSTSQYIPMYCPPRTLNWRFQIQAGM
jgi:hypothetical protein